MSSNSISPLILQNRLLSQAKSGQRTRSAAIGSALQNSSKSNSKSNSVTTASNKNTRETIESKTNYTSMKKAGESLLEHVNKLQEIYDREWEDLTQEEAESYRAKAETEITGFVDEYNTLVKTLSKESSSANDTYLKQLKNYAQSVKGTLSEIGITIENDSTLSIDKELLQAADDSKLQQLFGGTASFAGKTAKRAENIVANAVTNLSILNSSLYSGSYSYNKSGNDIFNALIGNSSYNTTS